MSDKSLTLTAFVIASVVTLAHNAWLDSWMLDDAFIFFRYAENWAAGHGPLFNVGEPPVEGFTSFLWLAILTLARVAGSDLATASIAIGHIVAIATLWLVSQCWRWLTAVDGRTAAFATIFVGSCGAFTPWARSGMETALHAFLITALLVAYLCAKEGPFQSRRYVLIGLLCALVAMNRPDGLLVVTVFGVDAIVRGFRRRELRGVWTTALVFLVLFGGYYAWRCWFFGYPFPNSFYAKVGSSAAQFTRGLEYVWDGILTLAPLVILPLVVGPGWKRADPNYLVIPVLLVVYVAYIVLVGGDVMPAHRFFTPIVPVMGLFAAMALRSFPSVSHWPVVAMSGGFGVVLIYLVITPAIGLDVVAHNGRIVGEWLRENAAKDATIATNTAGTVVYYSRLRAIDMLGLNDRHIAHVVVKNMGAGNAGHEKGDGDYVLRRAPEFIHLGSSLGWVSTRFLPDPPFLSGRQLWHNPSFRARYKFLHRDGPTLWPNRQPCGKFGLWVRNDVWQELEKGK